MSVLNAEKLIENRIKAIREFHKNTGIDKAELDLSGGIDSAVMAYLLVQALGKENVLLVHSRINTNPEQTARAAKLAEALEAPFVNFDLTPHFDSLTNAMLDALDETMYQHNTSIERGDVHKWAALDPTIMGSIRSTLRAPVGRGFNRIFLGGIRHGTGNECEDRFLRFYQKGGDGEVDTNPLAMLSKTEVFQMAYGIYQYNMTENNVGMAWNYNLAQCFKELITVKPSPDLWGKGDSHNDEDELKEWTGVEFTYGRVDPETGKIIEFGTIERVARLLDYGKQMFNRITIGEVLFDDNQLLDNDQDSQYESSWKTLVQSARESGTFPETMFTDDQVLAFLKAARHVEKTTRHKANPNIPSLGNRAELVNQGILSDSLA